MSSKALRDELSNDPLNRGYGTMSDTEAAADLNSKYRSRTVTRLGGGEVFDLADPTGFDGLNSAQQNMWAYVCSIEPVDPSGIVQTVAENLFGPNSTTVSNIQNAQTEAISRAQELGLGTVKGYDVAKAREQLS